MPTCAPKYDGKTRGFVHGSCSDNCLHIDACKKELNLPKDWEFPEWREKIVKHGTHRRTFRVNGKDVERELRWEYIGKQKRKKVKY